MSLLQWFRPPRKPASPSEAPVERPSAWKVPVAELGERMDYLEAALNKLRGQVTGAKRLKGADPEGVQSSEVDRNQVQTPQLTETTDRWLLLAEDKRRKRGLLSG